MQDGQKFGKALAGWRSNPEISDSAQQVLQHIDTLGSEQVKTELERKEEVRKFRVLVGTLLTSIAAHEELRQKDERVRATRS